MLKNLSLCVAVLLLSSAASAGSEASKKGRSVEVAQLSAEAVQSVTAALRSKPVDYRALNRAIPYFKVPAVGKETLICQVTRNNVLTCVTQDEAKKCPTTVDLRVPGLDYPVPTKVTCEPNEPDQNDECECELG